MRDLDARIVASEEDVGYTGFEVSAQKFSSLIKVNFLDPLHKIENTISLIRHQGDTSYAHLYSNVKKNRASKISGDNIYNAINDHGFRSQEAQKKLRELKVESFAMFSKTLTFVIDNGFFISSATLGRYQMTNNDLNITNI